MDTKMVLILLGWGVFVLAMMLVIRRVMNGGGLDPDRDQPPGGNSP